MNESNETPEERRKRFQAADEKFEEAIKEYQRAIGDYDPEAFLTDWMLLTAEHKPEPDGGSATLLAIQINNQQGLHRSIGLARYAVRKTEGRIK